MGSDLWVRGIESRILLLKGHFTRAVDDKLFRNFTNHSVGILQRKFFAIFYKHEHTDATISI